MNVQLFCLNSACICFARSYYSLFIQVIIPSRDQFIVDGLYYSGLSIEPCVERAKKSESSIKWEY